MLPVKAQINQLPCLNLTQGCQQLLLELAMENSSEFIVLRTQEELGKKLIRNQNAKAWTAWLTSNPATLVQNIFGGGRKQDIELALAQLQVELVKLKTQQENLANSYSENILLLLSEYNRLESLIQRSKAKLRIESTQKAIARIQYLQGGSSHSEMANFQVKTQDLSDEIESLQIQSDKILLELKKLTGVTNALETNLVDISN